MKRVQGYLVVLRESEELKDKLNPRYLGIDRIPAYPSRFKQEEQAMELYVYGGYKNKDCVIPNFKKALELWQEFLCSPRMFEVIFCRNHTFDQLFRSGWTYIGYDVSGIGDFWSIVGDFPSHPEMRQYLAYLNDYGVFKSALIAERFLQDYKRLQLPDYDVNFHVFELFSANLERATLSNQQGR